MASTIGQYMTPVPHSIGLQQPVSRALEFMRQHQVRHLPVLNGGQLVGILSEHDIIVLQGRLEGQQVGLNEDLTVEDVMSPEPYAVPATESLAQVLRTMAERRIGSVVVIQNGRVVGIYTSTDAVQALAKLTGAHDTERASWVPAAPCGLVKQLQGRSLANTLEQLKGALATAGFEILGEQDLAGTLKASRGLDGPAFYTVSVTSLDLAQQARQLAPQLGWFLPCNLVVRQTSEQEIEVSVLDPMVVFARMDHANLQKLAEELGTRLRRVLQALS